MRKLAGLIEHSWFT